MSAIKRATRTFQAPLQRTGDRLSWVVIRVPFDAAKLWGRRGQIKVKGELRPAGNKAGGFAFRTSLFPDGHGNHFMMVNKQMQKGAGVRPGMTAHFRMEPDTEKRAVAEPGELLRVLKQSKALRHFYDSLSYSTRSEISKWIVAARQKQTRLRRSEQLAERLMETLEAERDLPPLIKVAMTLNPKARAGWRRMPAGRKRGELLAIFYYRNPESRARRVAKAIAMMEEYAEKGSTTEAQREQSKTLNHEGHEEHEGWSC